MICTRCGGTGFLNLDQVDEETRADYEDTGNIDIILDWIDARAVIQIKEGGCILVHAALNFLRSCMWWSER